MIAAPGIFFQFSFFSRVLIGLGLLVLILLAFAFLMLLVRIDILEKLGRHTVANEFRSWDNSMQYMYKVMNDPEIPLDAGVAIEFNIPQTAKRVDFMISGYDINGKAQYKFLCEIQNPAWSDPRQQSPLTRPAAAIRH
jgi:hypothetical protein